MIEVLVIQYSAKDIDKIEEANSKKPTCGCKTKVPGQPTGTEIFNFFSFSLRAGLTRPGGERETALEKEPACGIHSRFQKYFCVNCLRLLCVECYEKSYMQHKVRDTKILIDKAWTTLRQNRAEIKKTVETLRELIRATKMKIRTTKWIDKHRLSMILNRRTNYGQERFQTLWIQEMTRIEDTREMQQQHLKDLLYAEQYFAQLSKEEPKFWLRLEVIKLPELQDFVKKLQSRHQEISPVPNNNLLKGLTLKVKPHKRVHEIVKGSWTENNNLNRPWGVCCNEKGEIFVADRCNHQVKVFSRDGILMDIIGSRGGGPLQFETPAGIAIHPNGNIVVVDKGNNRLQMITRNGELVRIFGQDLDHPMDVACSSLGEIAVTNEKGNCVHLYSTYGGLLRRSNPLPQWPPSMRDRCRKITPRGVCFTPDNFVAITDFIRNSIIILDRGLQRVMYEIRPHPSERIEKLQSIACDQFCNFVTADKHNSVHIFSFDGRRRVSFGNTGNQKCDFENPTGVCILPDGSICVSESGNNRIHIIV